MTPHFAAAEFACRDGTPYPARWLDARLRPLCELLEQIRALAGGPLVVISGYRTIQYNRTVGGARRSQHVDGRAADVRCPTLPADQLAARVLEAKRAGQLPTLGGLGAYPGWVHVDVRAGRALVRWRGSRVRNPSEKI